MAWSDFTDWWEENIYNPLYNFGQDISTGLQNFWYKLTGQSHLTPEFQYEQELADSAYQRAAVDMMKAGLSKFGGVNPASSPSPKSGQGLLATALAASQLKGSILANQENRWNLKKAKDWGVPTSAVGDFAKYDAAAKFLFGKSVKDIVGDGGLVEWVQKLFHPSTSSDGSSVSGDVAGAAVDAVEAVNNQETPILAPVYQDLFGLTNSHVYKPAPMELPALINNSSEPKYELKLEPFGPDNFEKPSDIGGLMAAAGLKSSDMEKDLKFFCDDLFKNSEFNDRNVDMVARILSQRYNVKEGTIKGIMKQYFFDNYKGYK